MARMYPTPKLSSAPFALRSVSDPVLRFDQNVTFSSRSSSPFWLSSSLRSSPPCAACAWAESPRLTLVEVTHEAVGRPRAIVTDRLRSYGAAMKVIGNPDRHDCDGRWINNQADNSHPPFHRRERAMHRFRRMSTLQKFTSVHAAFHNHFNHERHLIDRNTFKNRRSAAMAEWRNLASWRQRRSVFLRAVTVMPCRSIHPLLADPGGGRAAGDKQS